MALSGNDLALLDACWVGNIVQVRELLAAGADVAARDNDNWTPLHYAATCGHTDIASILLDAGAVLAARGNFGGTPEDLARGRGHTALADLLREAAEAARARRLAEPVVTGIDWSALVG